MPLNHLTTKTNFTVQCGIRGLGACYAAAFASSAVQIRGLVALSFSAPHYGEATLVAGAWTGCAAGVLVALGFFPFTLLALCSLLYFGLMQGGGEFYSFQWDALLLEAGVLTLFLCGRTPAPLAIWLPRLLLFRLMFRSGLVKLSSGDPTWASGTALAYHFETQPLPGPFSWYVHHLPVPVLKGMTIATLAIELALPFLIFLGRWPRAVAAAGIALLQLGIIATGNYGFFNVLTLILCVFLLDDRFFKRPVTFVPPALAWRRVVAALALPLSFFVGNSYGLFAVMTTERRELEIQGSTDGKDWKSYALPFKPGDVQRMPPFLLFHMPRLDWQLWFAALGSYQSNPWTLKLMEALLTGDPRVTALFAENPFPNAPPAFVRANFYRYTFTDAKERVAGAGWWRREPLPPYLPSLSLKASEPMP